MKNEQVKMHKEEFAKFLSDLRNWKKTLKLIERKNNT